jgi:ribonuclease BN (tRNA processing enzyme)
LGKSPAWQDAGGSCSGYLVEDAGYTLLLDCGNGVLGELRRRRDYARVDAVVLSHIHADHCLDLIPFSHALTLSPRGAGRPLLRLPPGARRSMRTITATLGDADLIDEAFEAAEYAPAEALALGPFTLRFAEVPHYVRTFALDVRDDDGGRFTFSADCGPNDALVALARETELLLIEATLAAPEGGEGRRGHLTAREAGEHGARAGARRLVLTHFSDELDGERVARDGAEGFGAPVELARVGAEYDPATTTGRSDTNVEPARSRSARLEEGAA